jgi:hypothetical protein
MLYLYIYYKLIFFALPKPVSLGRMVRGVKEPVENVVREPPVTLATGHAQTAVINLDTISQAQTVHGVSVLVMFLMDQLTY